MTDQTAPVVRLFAPQWLLPICPQNQVLSAHVLAVQGTTIAAVVPRAEAVARYPGADVEELPGMAILPGFVNAHTHSAMTLLRGLADDLPLMDWLQNHIWPTEGAHVSPAFCEDGVSLAIAEGLAGGTTCINDMYFFPASTAAACKAAGMRAAVNLIALDFPSAYASNAEDYIQKGLALHDSLRDAPLLSTLFGPHAPYTVSDAPLLKMRSLAHEMGIGMHMHVHETSGEVAMAVQNTGKRPWQRLKELDLLGPDFVAVHMTQLTDKEIAEAAEFGVHVAHCPESNLKLASGFCPVAKLLKAGVNVAIGTDGAASNNDLDLLQEARSASLFAKAVAQDATAFSAAEALYALTMGGAKALGLDDRIGSLEAGKQADFVVMDLSALNTQPLYNLSSQIVYAANSRQVRQTWVAGRCLYKDGLHLSLDTERLQARAKEWGSVIRPQ